MRIVTRIVTTPSRLDINLAEKLWNHRKKNINTKHRSINIRQSQKTNQLRYLGTIFYKNRRNYYLIFLEMKEKRLDIPLSHSTNFENTHTHFRAIWKQRSILRAGRRHSYESQGNLGIIFYKNRRNYHHLS